MQFFENMNDEIFFYSEEEEKLYKKWIENYSFYSLDILKETLPFSLYSLIEIEYNKEFLLLQKEYEGVNNWYGKSLTFIHSKLRQYQEENISTSLIPNTNILTNITVVKRHRHLDKNKDLTCYFCTEKISLGDYYKQFTPCFLDKDNNKIYLAKKRIILREKCNHYYPETISDYEILQNLLDRQDLGEVLDETIFDGTNPFSSLEFIEKYNDKIEFMEVLDTPEKKRERARRSYEKLKMQALLYRENMKSMGINLDNESLTKTMKKLRKVL